MTTQSAPQNDSISKELLEKKHRSERAGKWYYFFGMVLLFMAIIVFVSTCKSAVSNAPTWKELAKTRTQPDRPSPAQRGNIYSDDGTALAISIPKYRTYIDFKAGGFRDSIFLANLDAFADSLASYFGNQSKGAYKTELLNAYKNRNKKRQHRLLPFEVNHTQLKAIQKMPYISTGGRNRTGFYTQMSIRRERPFGTMASRTIGNLSVDVDSLQQTHGSSGLELAFDSLLCGSPGVNMIRRISGGWIPITKVPATDGLDVYTTINVGIQDITERTLRDMLIEVDADWGCAIVMEVESGKIKALSNLDRKGSGIYKEHTNHALADLLEPGSTFKIPSIMTALEGGFASPSDSVDTGNGLYTYARRVVRDHNAHRGGYHRISVAQSIWYSSNIGVVKTVLKGYEKNRKGFLKRLDEMSFFEPIKMEIPGVAKARINRDTDSWAMTSLPWISFGYETMVPPIYTCRFYNAIANGGKMMEPYIVTAIRSEKETALEREPRVVNKKIASEKTLKEIHQMLCDVVAKGTARDADSPHIKIAGKTGTAQRSGGAAGYEGQGHNVSFCGYFPAEKPKYTCMVTVSRPRNGYPSGGRIAGGVVRSIAEQIYATTMNIPINELEPDSLATFNVTVRGGQRSAIKRSVSLSHTQIPPITSGLWLRPVLDSTRCLSTFQEIPFNQNLVPDLLRLAPSDAILLAEKSGLHVQIIGHGGAVRHQSLKAGQNFKSGQTIILTLGEH